MKKTFCLLLVLAVLTGCAGPTAPVTSVPEISAAAEATQPALPVRSFWDGPGTVSALAGFEEQCIAAVTDPEKGPLLLSFLIPEGKLLAQTELTSADQDMCLTAHGAALLDQETLTLQLYNSDLDLTYRRQGDDLIFGTLGADGDFYGITKNSSLIHVDQNTCTQSDISLPDGVQPLFLASIIDGIGLLEYKTPTGDAVGWFDLSSGSALNAPPCDEDRIYSVHQSHRLYEGASFTCLRHPITKTTYVIPESGLSLLESNHHQALLLGPENHLIYWDLTHSSYYMETCSQSGPCVLCGSYAVYSGPSGGLMLWDPNLSVSSTAKILTPEQLEQENLSLAASLQEQAGFFLYFGMQGILYNTPDRNTGYRSLSVTDPILIRLALEQIQFLVDELPANLFRELITGNCDPLKVYLTGSILPTEEGSISDASAFTNASPSGRILAADISSPHLGLPFRATLVHEIMHIMEDRIEVCSRQSGLRYLDYWHSWLPDPELYFYRYHNQDGSMISDTEYTVLSSAESEEALFLDPYSRTFPAEDRARFLEHLYMGTNGPWSESLRRGIMAEKARYLCSMIRECFPSCAEAQILPWEVLVDPVPFTSYVQAVENYEMEAVG